jgi:hypothetical protein
MPPSPSYVRAVTVAVGTCRVWCSQVVPMEPVVRIKGVNWGRHPIRLVLWAGIKPIVRGSLWGWGHPHVDVSFFRKLVLFGSTRLSPPLAFRWLCGGGSPDLFQLCVFHLFYGYIILRNFASPQSKLTSTRPRLVTMFPLFQTCTFLMVGALRTVFLGLPRELADRDSFIPEIMSSGEN